MEAGDGFGVFPFSPSLCPGSACNLKMVSGQAITPNLPSITLGPYFSSLAQKKQNF